MPERVSNESTSPKNAMQVGMSLWGLPFLGFYFMQGSAFIFFILSTPPRSFRGGRRCGKCGCRRVRLFTTPLKQGVHDPAKMGP